MDRRASSASDSSLEDFQRTVLSSTLNEPSAVPLHASNVGSALDATSTGFDEVDVVAQRASTGDSPPPKHPSTTATSSSSSTTRTARTDRAGSIPPRNPPNLKFLANDPPHHGAPRSASTVSATSVSPQSLRAVTTVSNFRPGAGPTGRQAALDQLELDYRNLRVSSPIYNSSNNDVLNLGTIPTGRKSPDRTPAPLEKTASRGFLETITFGLVGNTSTTNDNATNPNTTSPQKSAVPSLWNYLQTQSSPTIMSGPSSATRSKSNSPRQSPRKGELPYSIPDESSLKLTARVYQHITNCSNDVTKDEQRICDQIVDMNEYVTKLANTISSRSYEAKTQLDSLAKFNGIREQASKCSLGYQQALNTLNKLLPLVPEEDWPQNIISPDGKTIGGYQKLHHALIKANTN